MVKKLTKLPNRKLTRLKEYDYSQSGYYFVTICTRDREHFFGKIVGRDLSRQNHADSNFQKSVVLPIKFGWKFLKNSRLSS
jgi:hypothetical protein